MWAMAWAEAGRAVEELDLAEEVARAEDGEGLLPDARHHLADAHLALVDDVELAARRAFGQDAPSPADSASAGPTMRTWASSSSSSSRKSGTVRRNSWITTCHRTLSRRMWPSFSFLVFR